MPKPVSAPLATKLRGFARHPGFWGLCTATSVGALAAGQTPPTQALLAALGALGAVQTWAWWPEKPKSLEETDTPNGRGDFVEYLEKTIQVCGEKERTTAALIVEIEEVVVVDGSWGTVEQSEIVDTMAGRIALCLREGDIICPLGHGRLGIILGPVRRADLDTAKSLAERIHASAAEPVAIGERTTHVSSVIGFCALSRAPERNAKALIAAAECALQSARKSTTDFTRAFTPAMQTQVETENQLVSFLPEALEIGEIRPWFQPQISAESGEISGFEALARWHHPELGVLMPSQFLPAIAAVSALPRLGEVMLHQSLRALQAWDQAGLRVPNVGINLSLEELRDPWLADGLQFELDRFDMPPSRLSIEILESVTLRDDEDVVVRNLQSLSRAGCRLELDDFGTGHASVRHVARFGARRIKIDRSFVTGVDQDASQKRLVSAILSMAEQLGVETLAEGVETPGEHSTLAQLGCQYVQGFGLSRPMPFEDTIAWISAHQDRVAAATEARRRGIG